MRAPQVLRLGLVRRPIREPGEVPHEMDIVVLGLGALLADGHALDHPLTQRADGFGVMEVSSLKGTPDLQTGRAGLDTRGLDHWRGCSARQPG